jgi:nucleotide-binding universal stress UspA family protein
MYRFKRIIVGLTLGEQDETKIRYAAMISRLALSEKVIFVHVIGPPENDQERPLYRGLRDRTRESICERMKELGAHYFDGAPETECEYYIMDDSPLIHIELLRRFKEMNIDLLILGKIRGELTKRGSVPVKVARKAPCSVVFVPEGMKPEFNNILVPVDFSDISLDALDTALSFAAASDVKDIRVINIYNVPIGYHKSGKTYDQFADIMKGHAENHFKSFVDKIDLRGVHVTPVFKLDRNPCRAIDAYVREHYIDLLIIGARGRRTGAAFVLGSLTEKLISSTSMPLFAVKRKDEGLSLFEALLRL